MAEGNMLLRFRKNNNEDLCELLKNSSRSSFELRTMAAVELGFRKDRKCLPALHEVLRGTNRDVVAVAWALKMIEDDSGINAFKQSLKANNFRDSSLAAERLGLLGDKSGLQEMLKIAASSRGWQYFSGRSELNGNIADNRMRVARALGTIRDSAAVPVLINLLDDDHYNHHDSYGISNIIVETTAIALLKIGDKTALEAMKKALARAQKDYRVLPKLTLAYEILSAPNPAEGFLKTLERQIKFWASEAWANTSAGEESLYSAALPMILSSETIRHIFEIFANCHEETTEVLGKLFCLTIDEGVWCHCHLYCYTDKWPYVELENIALLLDELKSKSTVNKATIANEALRKIRV